MVFSAVSRLPELPRKRFNGILAARLWLDRLRRVVGRKWGGWKGADLEENTPYRIWERLWRAVGRRWGGWKGADLGEGYGGWWGGSGVAGRERIWRKTLPTGFGGGCGGWWGGSGGGWKGADSAKNAPYRIWWRLRRVGWRRAKSRHPTRGSKKAGKCDFRGRFAHEGNKMRSKCYLRGGHGRQ